METDPGMLPPASSLIGTQDSHSFQHGAQEVQRSKQVGLNAAPAFPSGFGSARPRKLIIQQVVYFCRINRIAKAHPSLILMQIKGVLMEFLTAPKGRKDLWKSRGPLPRKEFKRRPDKAAVMHVSVTEEAKHRAR